MKYDCNLIKDLLPLYYDDACSDESKKIVEEHLNECNSCKALLKEMQDDTYDNRLQKEQNEVILRHTKNVKKKALQAGLCIIAVPLLICLIVNLVTSHTLDWFFIVLTATMVFVSPIATPLIVREKKRLWTFVTFTTSLILLFLACLMNSGGNWFFVTSVAVIFGLSVVFLPAVIGEFPLKGFALKNKGFLVMTIDTMLLYLLIITCGFYGASSNYWKPAFLITTVTVAFAWFLFGIIRYSKSNGFIKSGICVVISGAFISLIHDIIYLIINGIWHISFSDANLQAWNTDVVINANSYLLILISGCVIGFILLLTGFIISRKKK